MTPNLDTTPERLIAEMMPFSRIPGLAIAVVRDGEVILSRGFGVRGIRSGKQI